jgi:hypothetical protein
MSLATINKNSSKIEPGRLNRQAFLRYLHSLIVTGDSGREVDNRQLDDTRHRALYRWEVEGNTPDFFAADRWLSYFEIHIEEYFIFCCQENLDPWEQSEPSWHLLPRR